ncbi:hypothetical protein BKA70DRAFT_1438776 [Coprinopsis sp. MPI-PUGE-AT-0042]|nr:hypothetical protein BKA70DRAFT_1438776 [Coprinopsis sp. MPI-PUGE-AT-0042]
MSTLLSWVSRCPSVVLWLPREPKCRLTIITDTLVKFDIYTTAARVFIPQLLSGCFKVEYIEPGRLARAIVHLPSTRAKSVRSPPQTIVPLVQFGQDIHPRTSEASRASSSLGFHLPSQTSTILSTSRWCLRPRGLLSFATS